MVHPLFTLISQQPDEAPESPPAASGTSVADFPPLAAAMAPRTRGEAGRGTDGDRCTESETVLAVEPGMGWPVPSGPAVSVLAVIGPPGADGTPGRAHFAPGLTRAQIRKILFDLEWFDVRIRRREKAAAKNALTPKSEGA